jgi:hypothetical protein
LFFSFAHEFRQDGRFLSPAAFSEERLALGQNLRKCSCQRITALD